MKLDYHFIKKRVRGCLIIKTGIFSKTRQAVILIVELNHGAENISTSSFQKKNGLRTHAIIRYGIKYLAAWIIKKFKMWTTYSVRQNYSLTLVIKVC